MSPADQAPSLVVLAAAAEALETAASQVAGVREWIDRLTHGSHRLSDEEAVRLWVFAGCARRAAQRLGDDADRLAKMLSAEFLTAQGEWPLTKEQEREFHEVLAAVSARFADIHREKLDGPAGAAARSEETA